MPSRYLSAALVPLAFVASTGLFAGCGDEEPGTPQKTSSYGPGLRPSENFATARKYFQALASEDADRLEKAIDLSAPGSPARAYAAYLRRSATGGNPDTMTETDSGYRVCFAATNKCLDYEAITLSDGKINTFTIAGKPIEDWIRTYGY